MSFNSLAEAYVVENHGANQLRDIQKINSNEYQFKYFTGDCQGFGIVNVSIEELMSFIYSEMQKR